MSPHELGSLPAWASGQGPIEIGYDYTLSLSIRARDDEAIPRVERLMEDIRGVDGMKRTKSLVGDVFGDVSCRYATRLVNVFQDESHRVLWSPAQRSFVGPTVGNVLRCSELFVAEL